MTKTRLVHERTLLGTKCVRCHNDKSKTYWTRIDVSGFERIRFSAKIKSSFLKQPAERNRLLHMIIRGWDTGVRVQRDRSVIT